MSRLRPVDVFFSPQLMRLVSEGVLSCGDAVSLAMLDAQTKAGVLDATNADIARLFNRSETWASKLLSRLKELGFVRQVSFDGRTRVLEVVLPEGDEN